MAIIRETQEEISVTPIKYEKKGIIEFVEFLKGDRIHVKFHLYIATEWEWISSESEEMNPSWFSLATIPYEKMFAGAIYWLPLVLEWKKINAFFEYDEEWNLKKQEIKEVESL